MLLDVATSPGFTDETVRIFLRTGLTLVGRPDERDGEEAQLRVVRVPLRAAVEAVLAATIVNVMAVAGILAADAAAARPGGGPPGRVGRPAAATGPARRPAPGGDRPRARPARAGRASEPRGIRAPEPDPRLGRRAARLPGPPGGGARRRAQHHAVLPPGPAPLPAVPGRARADLGRREVTAADVTDFLACAAHRRRRPSAAGRLVGRPDRGRGARLAPVPARRGRRRDRPVAGRPAARAGAAAAQGAAGVDRDRRAGGGAPRGSARAAGPGAAGAAVRDRRADQRGRRGLDVDDIDTLGPAAHADRAAVAVVGGAAARQGQQGAARAGRAATRSRAVQAYLVRGRPALAAAGSVPVAGGRARCS